MLEYLSLDIISSLELTVFLDLCSQKTVHLSEQVMSADKDPSIFLHQKEAIIYIFPIFICEKYLKDNKYFGVNIQCDKNGSGLWFIKFDFGTGYQEIKFAILFFQALLQFYF